MKAENERLEKEITAWINENNIKASNLEWAKKEIKKLGGIKTTDWLIKGIPQKQLAQERIEALVDNAKTEAYKEFAERLKDGTGYYDEMIKDVVYTEEEVDNLLKELVGEDNAKEKE